MNSRSQIDQWLDSLGRRHAQVPWRLEETGVAIFQLGDTEMHVEVDQDDSPVGVFIDLGAIPDQAGREWLLNMLEANYQGIGTGGATLAIHPARQRFTIGLSVPVDMLDETSFEGMLEGLCEQAERWRTYIDNTIAYIDNTIDQLSFAQ